MHPVRLFLIAAILFLSASIFAQTDSLNCKSQVQFHLVNGYSVSYLNFYSEQSALRLKLDLGFSFNDDSGDQKNSPGLDSRIPDNTVTRKNKNNSQFIMIQAEYLNYPYKISGLRLFWGGGPFLSYDRSFYQTTTEQYEDQGLNVYRSNQLFEDEDYSFSAGIVSAVGVELSITQNISLIGEYNFYIKYKWFKKKYESILIGTQPISSYFNETSTAGWNLSLSNIKLGISYRF